MKKYFDLTWHKGMPLDQKYFGEQKDWNQTLMTKINQAGAQLFVVNRELEITKPFEKKLVVSENCKEIVDSLSSEFFDLNKWNEITYNSDSKNLIQVFYGENYVDITLLDENYVND